MLRGILTARSAVDRSKTLLVLVSLLFFFHAELATEFYQSSLVVVPLFFFFCL